MSPFKAEKVRVVRHGSTDFPYKETYDAYLIAADTVALCAFDALGGGRFAFYDTDGLTRKKDGYHLYDDAHPEAFVFEFAKTTEALAKLDGREIADMSVAQFMRLFFTGGESCV
ncbi:MULTISPECIES: hypothetical protein [Bacillus]|uniref:hypothetical protein n=1 Tax=Bacillus TaxID=1386 RepID=UPI00053B8450|nr:MULTISPECIES: hypothetical protein [Bacillus]AMK73952.1 hypothetical protein AWV81_18355 [Bacillus subtilis subsp. natto]API43663.1 hypothetical protein BSR08_14705 [Bacillus subtilis]API97227.1 hypothetical protein BKP58_15980 [Bacillus subtilis]ARI86077.1 hypothetical protein B7470_07975 [Bacillus subtilis]AVL04445.1 hypothetical protein BS21228_08545 [Bacillus subtilis]